MKFCVITPIAGLEQYARLSRTHLVLAQLMYDPTYANFYYARKQAGDFIILDNGAYENTKPLDSDAYFNWIKNLAPDIAVLPDILMSPWRKTTAASLKFLDQFADLLVKLHYKTEWMFVPQAPARDSDGWKESLTTVVNDGRMGHYITWIGLGRYLATEFPKMDYNQERTKGWTYRCNAAEYIRNQLPHLKVHALGMAAGSIEELVLLAERGVQSVDSSCAVWRGWNGYLIQSPEWVTKGTPCDFHAKMDVKEAHVNDQIIKSNLEVIFDAIR